MSDDVQIWDVSWIERTTMFAKVSARSKAEALRRAKDLEVFQRRRSRVAKGSYLATPERWTAPVADGEER